MKSRFVTLFLSCAAFACAQQPFDFKLLDKLGKNAKETTNLTLDENTIKLGASLFGGDDGDKEAKQLKDVIKGIKGIYIRSYEYAKSGMYNSADLEPVRAYFRSLNWSKILDTKSDDDNSEIYLNASTEGKVGGLAIVTSEAKEVTVVYISGSISPDQLGALSGKMGIPDMNLSTGGKEGKKPKKDEEEEK